MIKEYSGRCEHKSVERIGEQKSDFGVNVYLRCNECGGLIVATEDRKFYFIKGLSKEKEKE